VYCVNSDDYKEMGNLTHQQDEFFVKLRSKLLIDQLNKKKINEMSLYLKRVYLLNIQVNKATQKLKEWHSLMKVSRGGGE
jgi:hypothetical protein